MIDYLVIRLGDARELRSHMEDTTWEAELVELDRMIAMADWYNWSGTVPLMWTQSELTSRNIKRCAEFFEVPFEMREFYPA